MNNQGIGLGLIICQHLCYKHGGKIWLSSRELEGSIFSFTMEMPPADEQTENQDYLGIQTFDNNNLIGLDPEIKQKNISVSNISHEIEEEKL